MCGICGIVAIDGPLDPVLGAAVPAMAAAIGHRGPDGQGVYQDDRAALGHRRLSIIDRAGGTQPLSNEDGSCWVTFNGEIYNHRELRRALEGRGHRFRTVSDTETIVHAYEEFGPSCVDHLEGMFAFAVYDKRSGDLFLARDRLGKKPLYYGVLDGTLHFASEIKALYCSPAWNGAVDFSQLEGYLALGYSLAPQTIYRYVKSLEPGHWLRLSGGAIEVRRYWDVPDFDSDSRGDTTVLEDLEQTIAQAVHGRLESEVPLGAFLSGGIDSGLVVSFMAEAVGRPITTTSVGFGDPPHNELDAAAVTARHFSTDHHAEMLELRLEDVLQPIFSMLDEPLADSSVVPTYYVSKVARRHVTVALSGDGGDEAFAGYDFRYVPHRLEDVVRRSLPASLVSAIAGTLAPWWPSGSRLPRPLRLRNVLTNLSTTPADAYFHDLCFLKPDSLGALTGTSPTALRNSRHYQLITQAYNRCPSSDAVQKAEYADLQTYLPNDVLVKVDRMSMAHSLEIRCPLLDRRVIELAFRIPASLKLKALHSKHLLRRLALRRLPKVLAQGPKRGFTAPVAAWLRGRQPTIFEEMVLTSDALSRDLLDRSRVRHLYESHRRGAADRSYALWAVLALEVWQRQHRSLQRESAISGVGPPVR